MEIKQIINSVFNSNTFILSEEGKAIIIDLGDFELVKEYLMQNSLIPEGVLITHVHYDHIYGVPAFKKEFPGIPIYTSKEGIESFKNPKWNFSRYHNDNISIDSPQINLFPDNLKVPNIGVIKGFSTPGHDHSCVTYQIEDNLFTGDSYIPGIKVVNTFPKNDKEMSKLWFANLEELSKVYNIFPGHGPIKYKKLEIQPPALWSSLKGIFQH